VESGTAGEIFGEPRHPYTAGLLKSIPSLSGPKDLRLTPIDGIMPDCVDKADICQFLPRCSRSVERCRKGAAPRLAAVDGSRTHLAACYVPVREAGRQHAPAASRAGSDAASRQEAQILEVRNLKIHFPVTKGFFRRRIGVVKAVDDVTFSIERGKTLGLVGESGCGKTTVARSVLRLYRPTAGQILFEGRDIAGLAPRAMRKLRRNMSLVFQDPYSSLDPRQKAADIVGEPLRNYRLTRGEGEYRDRIEELFRLVGLDPSVGGRVPHEFSGGQRQRIGIARALATSPSLIVCDEAISALDVSIQAQIINLLEDLQHSLGLAYLFIAHDLSVVRHISDHVAVMYLGKVVEHAAWRELYEDPLHPYTQALLAAVPVPDPAVEARRTVKVIKGEVPSLMNRPPGCVFSNRCPLVSRECTETEPALRDLGVRHFAACIKA
jgi:peptide/nickel transport system ATP-binding protein